MPVQGERLLVFVTFVVVFTYAHMIVISTWSHSLWLYMVMQSTETHCPDCILRL